MAVDPFTHCFLQSRRALRRARVGGPVHAHHAAVSDRPQMPLGRGVARDHRLRPEQRWRAGRPCSRGCTTLAVGGRSAASRRLQLKNVVRLMLATALLACQSCQNTAGSARKSLGRCLTALCASSEPWSAYAHRLLLVWPQAALRDPQLRHGRVLHPWVGGWTRWTGLVAEECRGPLLVERQARCCGPPIWLGFLRYPAALLSI